MITVREYRHADLAAVTELMSDLGYPTDMESMQKRMDLIEANPLYATFVAVMDEQVVGLIGTRLVHYYEGDGAAVQISALVTQSRHQGKGIGRQLVQFVERWAAQKGADSVSLTSGIKPEREKAHAFYKMMGYDVTGYRFVKKLV
ncbi:GNAT family N-acetyltransferase [Paenibacillus piri]|uniref:GNAT family N-acetyltransferase n=1 Tax=Paenibacillus piri TaxID=2547395 RepID=A0A4R5K7Y1_9BACL|nr:GNAT family N-acetyltransferase [Paenibacillus piri]TDF91221.1 GNAT family N-acetyltransferase [Paenibacillus piri]